MSNTAYQTADGTVAAHRKWPCGAPGWRPRPQFRPVTAATGFGWLALQDLLAAAEAKPADPIAPMNPHFEPKAKCVIFLVRHGGRVRRTPSTTSRR